jgi:Tetratricopeptide repeat
VTSPWPAPSTGSAEFSSIRASRPAPHPESRRSTGKILGREHPDVVSTQRGLAVAVHLQGRYAEAEVLQREVLALARSHYGPMHWQVAEALCNLAASLTGQLRGAEAIPLYEEALSIRRRILGEKHWQVAQVLLLLAELNRHDKTESFDLAAVYLFGSRADDGLRLLRREPVAREGSDFDVGVARRLRPESAVWCGRWVVTNPRPVAGADPN